MKWSVKDDLSVEDIEWGSSDRPLLLMSDGTVRLYNIKMTECNSPSPAHYIGLYLIVNVVGVSLCGCVSY